MPLINDTNLFPITPITAGSTWIGSAPDGKTVQYSAEEMTNFMNSAGDVVFIQNATKVGRVVIVNLQSVPASSFPTINGGGTAIAEVIAFPITGEASLKNILTLRS